MSIFDYLVAVDSFFWSYIGFILIILMGLKLSIQARFFQIRAFPSILKNFFGFLKRSSSNTRGIHPLNAFFASVGGMIGIGNVVGIVTAVQLGGPGALLWVWLAALIGSIIKYSEIFLGLQYRKMNDRGGYDGGPIYFLQAAFDNRWVSIIFSSLLCIYGVEVYQFVVVTDSLSTNFELNRYMVMAGLLFVILFASKGGIARIGKICSRIMPVFMVLYISMSIYIIFQERAILLDVLMSVFTSAFTGHAAIGGFAGSSASLAIQHGIARAAYSADIGIGYDSIIQAESNTIHPERQAGLAVLGVGIDNLICTMSILVVLVSGIWKSEVPIDASQLVQTALGQYFPFMDLFMPFFLLIVGYTTIIAYFAVGIKSARFLSPKYGATFYVIYAVIAWIFFSFFDQTEVILVMSLAQSLLLLINLSGIYVLRKSIVFAR